MAVGSGLGGATSALPLVVVRSCRNLRAWALTSRLPRLSQIAFLISLTESWSRFTWSPCGPCASPFSLIRHLSWCITCLSAVPGPVLSFPVLSAAASITLCARSLSWLASCLRRLHVLMACQGIRGVLAGRRASCGFANALGSIIAFAAALLSLLTCVLARGWASLPYRAFGQIPVWIALPLSWIGRPSGWILAHLACASLILSSMHPWSLVWRSSCVSPGPLRTS